MNKEKAKELAKLCQLFTPDVPVLSGHSTKGKVVLSTLMEEFQKWLVSFEGGKFIFAELSGKRKALKLRHVAAITGHVKLILQLVCGDQIFPPESIVLLRYIGKSPDENGLVHMLKKDLSWATIKTYLASLSHFLSYLKTLPEWTQTWANHGELQAMHLAYERTMATVCKLAKVELQQRKQNDSEKLIPVALIAAYLDSRVLQDARKMCDTRLPSNAPLATRLNYFTTCRNHLLLTLAVTNCKRTSVFSEMLVSEFAKTTLEDDMYVFDVLAGKTLISNGAATIVTLERDNYFIDNFINKHRPTVSPKTNNIILNMNGDEVSSSDINRYLKMAWSDFSNEINQPLPNITCSIIRKTMVSKSRDCQVSRDVQFSMAQFFDHSLITADSYYSIGSRHSASTKTLKLLFDIMKASDTYNSTSDECVTFRHQSSDTKSTYSDSINKKNQVRNSSCYVALFDIAKTM